MAGQGMITVVGGVYLERCMSPAWNEYFGSGGRAASAIANLGGPVKLVAYADENASEVLAPRAYLEGFECEFTPISRTPSFAYHHSLQTPVIDVSENSSQTIHVKADNVVQFGMIEGDAIIEADFAVYDPQSPDNPKAFNDNGSKTQHLALILNEYEAAKLLGKKVAGKAAAEELVKSGQAEVVIIKRGAKGALLVDATGAHPIPAYKTDNVWKVGSGDVFVATFGHYWMGEKLSPLDAAINASKAVAYYVSTKGFISPKLLAETAFEPIVLSERFQDGYVPNIYLAGPFFSMGQLWLINEARQNLREMGLTVFSPYHDVGRGSAEDVVQKDLEAINNCDLLYAIGDGMDSGTIFEIGYARALNIPVVMYSENETPENRKMMEGSGCHLCEDYVTSIYKSLWVAITL